MKRLKELLDSGHDVVCFITYDWNGFNKGKPDYQEMLVTDVCMARYIDEDEYSRYTFSCRGNGYFEYWLKGMPYNYTFEELLESRDIQFIEPKIKNKE